MSGEGGPDATIYSGEIEERPEKMKLSDEDRNAVRSITLGIEEVAPDVREMAMDDVISTLENGHPLNRIIPGKDGGISGYVACEDFTPHEAYIKYMGTDGQLGRNLLREIPAFLDYAKQQGYSKLNFHGWNERLNHILERYGFKRLSTDKMGEFSVDFYEKSLVDDKSPEELSQERAKAFEQKYLAKIQKDYEQTLKTFSEENRTEKEKAINDANQVLASRLQSTEGFEFTDRAQAVLKLKLARYFQDNGTIDQNTLYDAVIETPKFLQSDKGSLFRLFEVHQQKTLQRIAEIRKSRAEMIGDEEFNPYEALFQTKSGDYYLARLLNMPHLEEESDYMNHCVGTSDSYVNRMKKGGVEIFSFRHIPKPDPNTGQLEIDKPIITIVYNLKTKTIEQIKKNEDAFLQPDDPFYDDMIDALKKLRTTETDTGELRDFRKISESELGAITVSDFHVLTENGEVHFRDFNPDSGEFILKIGTMPIGSETTKSDIVKIVHLVEGIRVEEGQIAQTQEGLSAETKLYFGQLQPNIFQQYPSLENIYTSFTEGIIRKGELGIGGVNKEQLKQNVKDIGTFFDQGAEAMTDNPEFTTQENREQIITVRLRVRDLGFQNGATTEQIYAKAQEFGLELCPAEVGLHQRISNNDQPLNDWYSIAMDPVADQFGCPCVFNLRHGGDGLWLYDHGAKPSRRWNPGGQFVFRLRKISQED